ncbi:MAG: hypothetical protein ABI854_02650 [Betaproteobacteria bacterium]
MREPLAREGIRARITDTFVADAICIAHRDHLNRFCVFCERAYIVAVRADRPPVRVGRREIVQNLLSGRGDGARYIPLWPQPGLIPRDTARNATIEHIGYFGRDASMPEWLQRPEFTSALRRIGLEFRVRTDAWHDYSDVDLIVAHRVTSPTLLHEKPASKLVNAWHAGVPALLSDEPAYAALRRSALDYRVVDSRQSLLRQIMQLRADPALYLAMVGNGRIRAREFTATAVRERWLDVIINDVIPDFTRSWTARPPLLRYPPFVARLSEQKLQAKLFRHRMASELQRLHAAQPSSTDHHSATEPASGSHRQLTA